MSLSEFKADNYGRIKSIAGDVHFAKRITSIGITEYLYLTQPISHKPYM